MLIHSIREHSDIVYWLFSRNGEVLGSRKDFKMNCILTDLVTGSAALDSRSLSLINVSAVQQQHEVPRPVDSELYHHQ